MLLLTTIGKKVQTRKLTKMINELQHMSTKTGDGMSVLCLRLLSDPKWPKISRFRYKYMYWFEKEHVQTSTQLNNNFPGWGNSNLVTLFCFSLHQNIRVRTVQGQQYKCRSGVKFHGDLEQKFLLVDCRTVLYGTYRWVGSTFIHSGVLLKN